MNNYTYSDELYHYGIKGQKWGQRHYQYDDGTYTPEGKRRYGFGDGRKQSSLRTAKQNYRIASRSYDRAFNNAYYRSGIHITKKGREADRKRWEKVYTEKDNFDKARKQYKLEKQKYKANVKSKKAVYKEAKKASNKAFNEAYRKSGIHFTKKGRDAANKAWERYYEEDAKRRKAKAAYKKAKQK